LRPETDIRWLPFVLSPRGGLRIRYVWNYREHDKINFRLSVRNFLPQAFDGNSISFRPVETPHRASEAGRRYYGAGAALRS
jgi:hypothetical protein